MPKRLHRTAPASGRTVSARGGRFAPQSRRPRRRAIPTKLRVALAPPPPQPGNVVRFDQVRAVVVFADEPRALADWYRGVVQAREVVSSPRFIGLACGAVTLFVQQSSEGHRPGMGGVRPHFTVDDCAAAFAELIAAGARPILGVTDTGGELVAAVRDPAGNPLGLLEMKRR